MSLIDTARSVLYTILLMLQRGSGRPARIKQEERTMDLRRDVIELIGGVVSGAPVISMHEGGTDDDSGIRDWVRQANPDMLAALLDVVQYPPEGLKTDPDLKEWESVEAEILGIWVRRDPPTLVPILGSWLADARLRGIALISLRYSDDDSRIPYLETLIEHLSSLTDAEVLFLTAAIGRNLNKHNADLLRRIRDERSGDEAVARTIGTYLKNETDF